MKRLLLGVEPEPEGFGEPGSRIPRLGRLGWAVFRGWGWRTCGPTRHNQATFKRYTL